MVTVKIQRQSVYEDTSSSNERLRYLFVLFAATSLWPSGLVRDKLGSDKHWINSFYKYPAIEDKLFQVALLDEYGNGIFRLFK